MAEPTFLPVDTTTKGMLRTGWVLTAFVGLFLLVDGGARLAGFAPYVEGMTQFGYAASLAPWIGLALLLCTIAMLIPRTAVLGCILVTGYLGGAVATQVRVGDGWFLFPVALGALSWLGLYLRDARVRALVPFRT
jgi:DoxX-like family